MKKILNDGIDYKEMSEVNVENIFPNMPEPDKIISEIMER